MVQSNTERRFWSKVDKDPNGCWYWRACLNKEGYGHFGMYNKVQRAHRVAFFFTYGKWPICDLDHLCKTRHCVNPAHLEEVSTQENIIRGASTNTTKIDIVNIKLCLAVGFRTSLIAEMFNVSQPSICNIAAGRRWKNI